ncbi:MAG: Holliday junction branch migration protein RuvA, partial [Alphaproteobacteria bacterium]|nr:Holliday junction branch migration protein RuvA [Alphaproteobacteria bacterium]
MIARLTGRVAEIAADSAVLDVGGVGYLVHASRAVLERLQGADGPVTLLIETQVREDAITLYGFFDRAEREWFRLLMGVQGVGGRVALAILSVLPPEALTTAILAEDRRSLTRADGVGPKLAGRL